MRELAAAGTGITITAFIHPGYKRTEMTPNYTETFLGCIVASVETRR